MQVGPVSKLQEIQSHKVIKVCPENIVVRKIKTVIQFSKFQDNLHNLGLASGAEACVVLSPEDTFDTFINHLWADWILSMVFAWIKVRMHLGDNQHSFEVLHIFRTEGFGDCALNVHPDIWSIVSIEVNDLFFIGVIFWCITLKCDGVQIILIGFATDDINGLVHADLGVLLTVFHLITGQNPVVADLLEFNFSLRYFSPF
jgi:hypothetical protein